MSYTIPPNSPKATHAIAFGLELRKALGVRGVPIIEIERSNGIGHTSMDNYLRGRLLPKTEVARVLAAALRWPKLAVMVEEARTFKCGRSGCARTFRNDTGAPRRYCSPMCTRIASNLRVAARRKRKANATGDGRSRAAVEAQLRSGIRIATEQLEATQIAIDAMCNSCEPEGVCRTIDCPLRAFSPLPFSAHKLDEAQPRTEHEIRVAAWQNPERRARASERSKTRWADPDFREARLAEIAERAANETPEQKAAKAAAISATKRRRNMERALA